MSCNERITEFWRERGSGDERKKLAHRWDIKITENKPLGGREQEGNCGVEVGAWYCTPCARESPSSFAAGGGEKRVVASLDPGSGRN